jgi:Uma2 family endonuclease
LLEQRLKIREGKYRVPDVMVIAADAPRTPVIERPPLLCIEIVSPDDRLRDLTERARDYLALGVPESWIFDPSARLAYVYSASGLHEAPRDAVLCAGKIELSVSILERL